MSRDGYLPDNVREGDKDAPWNEQDHDPKCGQHEDAKPMCECGHEQELHSQHSGKCWVEVKIGVSFGGPIMDWCRCDGFKLTQPECICNQLAEDREASRADAMEDAAQERFWDDNGE